MKSTLIQTLCKATVTGTVLCVQASAIAAVIYVDHSAMGWNDGTSWDNAMTDLQDALTLAVPGDEIWVAAGSYRPAGPVELGGRGRDYTDYLEGMRMASFHLNSGVALYGGFAGEETEREARDAKTNKTVLSGDLNGNDRPVKAAVDLAGEATRSENSYHVVTTTGADDTAILDGFIIAGGYANGPGHDDGGGMINLGQPSKEGPTIIDCGFEWNFAFWNGGGIYSASSDLMLIRCTFSQNHAHVGAQEPQSAGIGGGGFYTSNADPSLFDCILGHNSTLGQGGGMLNLSGSPVLIRCRFEGNRSLGEGFRNAGGGLWMRELGIPLILNCFFFGNSAAYGGGAASVHDADPTFVNTIFSGNVATHAGTLGAGSGYHNLARAMLINCTFSGNVNKSASPGKAALYINNESSSILRNCIFWANSAAGISDRGAQIDWNGGFPDISHCCVQGGWDQGVGNFDLDPLFRDIDGPDDIIGTADDDLRLTLSSPCLDTGDYASLPRDTADLDGDGDREEAIAIDLSGNRRLRGGEIDMGAYEYGLALTAGDPTPINAANDVFRDVVLTWEPGAFAQTRNVYLGAARDTVYAASTADPRGVLVSEGQEGPSFDPGRLAFGRTYYWRVDEVNAAPDYTIRRGKVWSFTVEAEAYPVTNLSVTASSSFDVSVADRVVDGSGLVDDLHGESPLDMWISSEIPATIQFDFDRAHKLHEMLIWNSNQLIEGFVGFGAKDVVLKHSLDGENWTTLAGVTQLAQAPGTKGYAANNRIDFAGTTAQHARLTINSVHGVSPQASLSEVRFTAIPVRARHPQPAEGATADSPNVVLAWHPGREAASHEVHLSEYRDAVEAGTALIATTADPWLDVTDLNLALNTTYYWKVDEVNNLADVPLREGLVWHFTTPNAQTP